MVTPLCDFSDGIHTAILLQIGSAYRRPIYIDWRVFLCVYGMLLTIHPNANAAPLFGGAGSGSG